MTVRENRGFTLIELLVVLSIVAILAAIIIPIGDSIARQRDQSTCFFNLKTLGMALENYRQDFRGFPPDITENVNWGDTRGTTKGLGLYTLYYLTAGHGVPERDLASYLSSRKYYHCPRSPVTDLPQRYAESAGLPADATLGGWNNYDGLDLDGDGTVDQVNYRRVRTDPPGLEQEGRLLIQPFPAPTTVVTWCDFHHRSGHTVAQPGDRTLVLWVDQTVDWIIPVSANGTTLHPAAATQEHALLGRQQP